MALVLVCTVSVGCKPLRTSDNEVHGSTPLRAMQMSADSVGMEVVLAELPEAEMDSLIESLHPYLDQQKVEISERMRWNENGLVVGTLHSAWPGALRDALQRDESSSPEDGQVLNWDELETMNRRPTVLMHKRMQFDSGEPRDIPVSDYLEVARWRFSHDGTSHESIDSMVRGWMRAMMTLDRGSAIELTLFPKVTYGQSRQQVGVFNENLSMQTKQNEANYAQIPVHVVLVPGETLVVYSKSETGELGDLLYGSGNAASPDLKRMLLVRLVHTQHDDLFESRSFR